MEKILNPYAKKSYDHYYKKYHDEIGLDEDKSKELSLKDVRREFEQGFQGWEYKFNTVASSRGDYPFITITAGNGTEEFERMAIEIMLRTRMGGQGKKGFKRPVLFPKIVFLYDENVCGEGKENEDIFDLAIECSSKTMYPDYLSLTGQGYISEMYKKYGKVISPMGCVDGNEVITYKINDILFVESFSRMWLRLSMLFTPQGQSNINDQNLYIDLQNIKIFDNSKNDFVECKRIIRNISSQWCNIKFTNGRRIRCTNDHPFEIIGKGVVYAENLALGDSTIANYNQYSENYINMNSDVAWLLGFILCDGSYAESIVSSIAAIGEDDIEKKYINIVKNYFGLEVQVILQERGSKGTYKDLIIKSDNKGSIQKLRAMLNSLFGGQTKNNRQIPNEVFSWTIESKMSFLAGMIDADGYIDSEPHCFDKKFILPIVQIGSTNLELAIQQLCLAQSLGMKAKVYENHYNRLGSVRFRVEFAPTEELVSFLSCNKKANKFSTCPILFENSRRKTEDSNIVSVSSIEFYNYDNYSYDVTTESEHFEVSGIYSHNCRAFLSPWYERGGAEPADENDVPIFEGRFNIGAISLNLPMILAKSRQENKDFYDVLDYYLEMIKNLHLRTYDYLGEMKASTNPLAYCEGGFLGGTLNPNDKIKPILESATASFGITAFNELQELYNGKSLVEDGEFALEVLKYINVKKDQFSKETGRLFAIYGTPAENLSGLQVKQFKKKYGIIDKVSDREYFSNSWHCHVTEDIDPITKQDKEYRFWELSNGGKIQFVKYPIDYNIKAIKTVVLRAMKLGFYEGVNLSLSYCEECGHQEVNMDVCPICGCKNITKLDRICGYLGYTRVHGEARISEHKLQEIKERKSM